MSGRLDLVVAATGSYHDRRPRDIDVAEHREPLTLLDMIGAAVAGLTLVACVAMLFVIPSFVDMYRDFTIALPLLTVLVVHRWPIVLAVLVSGSALAAGALGPGIPSLLARRLLMLASLCVAALAIGLTVVGLYLPVFEMSAAIDAPPREAVLELSGQRPAVEITLSTDGSLFLDSVATDLAGLRHQLCERVFDHPDARVAISAHRSLRYAAVMDVVDVATECGVSRLVLTADSAP
jgi:biopolymer transport protein ExbD